MSTINCEAKMKVPAICSEFPTDSTVELEVRRVLISLDAVRSLSQGGEFIEDLELEERAQELEEDRVEFLLSIMIKLRDYAFEGKQNVEGLDEDSMYSAIMCVVTGYEACDALMLGLPNSLCAILNAVVARGKINEVLGYPLSSFSNIYPGKFEAGRIDGLTIYELSLLSGVKEQVVRNTVPTTEGIKFVKNLHNPVYLTKADSLTWLKARRMFRSTYTEILDDDVLTVPMASDGTVFDMSCRAKKGFQVGPAGSEIYLDNYLDALQALKEMKQPRWRRPSQSSGKFGRVTGSCWVSKTKYDLGVN
jgi:hypothetical protein